MASPAQAAPPQIVDVPLALFGGTHTGVAPPDLPEGLSPDSQDMAFVPGEAFTRPCLAALWGTGNPKKRMAPAGNVAMLYCKTYVQPNGDALTLALDAAGNLWVEDVGNSPGTASQLAAVTAGISALSASAFGREYIAFSDLLTGQWCPLQYDGTNLDRVTQDGPGVGPTCQNSTPPVATLQNTGAGGTVSIVTVTPSGLIRVRVPHPVQEQPPFILYYTTLTIVTSTPHGLAVGQIISTSGVTPGYNFNNVPVLAIVNSTTFTISFLQLQDGAFTGTGGTVGVQNPSLSRSNNQVTATTAQPHGFQVGWQVQISGIPNTNIGGGIASISRDGNGNVTVVTTTPHGLPIQAQIAIVGVTLAGGDTQEGFNGNFTVASVLSPVSFTYAQGGPADTGVVTGANVQDIWNVTAFIQAIPSANTFVYEDFGPNDFTNVSGTATIIGQISPGAHQVVVAFLDRQGGITKPSPPVTFYANGAQQLLLTNLPLGNSTIVARIIGLTGAGGDNFFVIPATPKVGTQIVGTSTIISDNTSTSAVIDFADNTLFDGIAIDQPGNDLFDQRTLIAPVGFYAYASRLFCWYDYNAITNLLNMTLAAGANWATVSNVAGSGANSGGPGSPWVSPGNVATPNTYAGTNLSGGTNSQHLLAESFAFAVAGDPRQISVSVPYYFTGCVQDVAGDYSLVLTLLKAGVPTGLTSTTLLPTGAGGTSAAPLLATAVFTTTAFSASDINNAAFGVEIAVTGGAGLAAVYCYVGQPLIGVLLPTGASGWALPTTGTTATVNSTFPGITELFSMTSAGGAFDCLISQPAYQDVDGTAILAASTFYQFRCFLSYAAGITAGNFIAELFSPTQGSLATATVALNAAGFTGFQIVPFSGSTPSAIPSDTVLRYYLAIVTTGQTVLVGETSMIYAAQPFRNNVAFASYTLNPEGFAQTTGVIGSADDPSPIRCFSIQRTTTLLKTAAGTHAFQDNDLEPYQWVVNNLSRSVGACSIRAGDPGQFGTGDAAEDWDVTANQNGLYLFAGGDFWKISQELDEGDPTGTVPTWEDVNWSAEQTLVVKNDPKKHRIYILAPLYSATQPSICWALDYKELDTASDLYGGPSLKIGLTGKMLSTDKTRKWDRWNISANDCDILVRPGNDKEMAFAGGTRNGTAYGNLYTLNAQQFTDDDYGQMSPYYTTYFFVNHEQEQQLGLGTARKLMRKICADIPGIGYVTITPLVNSLNNPLPQTTPRVLAQDSNPANLVNRDLEWTVAVRGERIALRIAVFPLPGQTDVQMRLRKIIPHLMKDPVIQHYSSAI